MSSGSPLELAPVAWFLAGRRRAYASGVEALRLALPVGAWTHTSRGTTARRAPFKRRLGSPRLSAHRACNLDGGVACLASPPPTSSTVTPTPQAVACDDFLAAMSDANGGVDLSGVAKWCVLGSVVLGEGRARRLGTAHVSSGALGHRLSLRRGCVSCLTHDPRETTAPTPLSKHARSQVGPGRHAAAERHEGLRHHTHTTHTTDSLITHTLSLSLLLAGTARRARPS